jgi:hypothetical protein
VMCDHAGIRQGIHYWAALDKIRHGPVAKEGVVEDGLDEETGGDWVLERPKGKVVLIQDDIPSLPVRPWVAPFQRMAGVEWSGLHPHHREEYPGASELYSKDAGLVEAVVQQDDGLMNSIPVSHKSQRALLHPSNSGGASTMQRHRPTCLVCGSSKAQRRLRLEAVQHDIHGLHVAESMAERTILHLDSTGQGLRLEYVLQQQQTQPRSTLPILLPA